MRRLPLALRRALALLLLGAALSAGGLLAWAPVRWLERQEARLAALEARIDELRERIAEREQLLAESRLLEEALRDETLFVRAATPALAAAELQGLVSAAVRAHGGEVLTSQVLEPVEAPPFREIGLKLTLSAGLEALVGLLRAIESNRPLLLVRSLRVGAGGGEGEGRPLATEIELVAFESKGGEAGVAGGG